MAVSLAHQEPGQQRVAPPQREPRLPLDTPTPEIVVAPEIEAVQGGRFSPLTHSCDEEDVSRIAAALLLPLLYDALGSPEMVLPEPSPRGFGASSA
ncbi:hypothetical protein M5K25_013880 [Dendrobium thyrsiflorum]|uniref:Uncharacterized protein n=1 Tax=Dendrobium thyrsiflorum TaxID=117978 RepID=A0ABD0UUB6_DENTH